MLTGGIRPRSDRLGYNSYQWGSGGKPDSTTSGDMHGDYQWYSGGINLNAQHKFNDNGTTLSSDASFAVGLFRASIAATRTPTAGVPSFDKIFPDIDPFSCVSWTWPAAATFSSKRLDAATTTAALSRSVALGFTEWPFPLPEKG